MKNVFKYASVIGCTFFSISFGANYIDYKVKNGDTLYGIAFAHDMSASEFLKLNNIKDPNEYKLKVGETLKVKEAGYSLVYDSERFTISGSCQLHLPRVIFLFCRCIILRNNDRNIYNIG